MSGIQRWECRVATNANGRPYVDDIEYAAGRYVLHSDHEAEIARLRAEVEHLNGELALADSMIAKLRTEADSLRKDAERYRWLRDTPWFDNYEIRSVIAHQQNALWDKTIDAAMGASA